MLDPYEADKFIHALARDWRFAPLDTVDRALCEFAAKLTHHANEMTPEDINTLRDHGMDDRAIHDAVQVIGYFNYINRVAESLGVDPEDFIRTWGSTE